MAVIKTVQEESLVALGDAIREKAGTSEPLMFPTGMIEAIEAIETGGGGGEAEPIVLTGDCSYACSGALAANYMNFFGKTISTANIANADYMFFNTTVEKIPFVINFNKNATYNSVSNMFQNARQLKTLPKIPYTKPNACYNFLNGCQSLRHIPEDWTSGWDWSRFDGYNSAYAGGDMVMMFANCYSLRSIPVDLISHGNRYTQPYGPLYYSGFSSCYVLDEITDLFVYDKTGWTSNAFQNTFDYCYRLKNMTFAMNADGTPQTATWTNQTIDLSRSIGHAGLDDWYILSYNSGITADKKVVDDASYQALKNDPDYFTCNIPYSRYNHDSAVATINSLPDCSATGTNTIKFKGEAGSATDGGAINTLTEEEIAVAAAKGWTVSFV